MGDQTQAYDIFQTPLSSGYPLPLIYVRQIQIKKVKGIQTGSGLELVTGGGCL
jgi:hypothetical protein